VIFLTSLLIFINFTAKTKAGDNMFESAHNTIIADLVKSEFSEFDDDERLIVETFDSEPIISATQQNYLDNLSAFKPQARVSMNGIEDDPADDLPTIQNGSNIMRTDTVSTQITKRPRNGTVDYTVQNGDTISTIAAEFEISVSTILWENNLSAYSIIKPGQTLKILPASGVTHKVAKGENLGAIAKKYNIEESKILESNNQAANAALQIGQDLFIPGGSKISLPKPAPVKQYTGIAAIKEVVSPSGGAAPVPGNKMNWPANASRITQYYSWKHTGLDIAAPVGTDIYASDAGTIEYIGWGTGYGNQIVIDHGGGKKTRYAHLSKFYVKKGAKISKGQTIAAMGSTGWSTGSHLHFEVIINGRKYNPLSYIR
jgi:murein DD-endopeptidase MepM/ murein hydrolase activator NlpD